MNSVKYCKRRVKQFLVILMVIVFIILGHIIYDKIINKSTLPAEELQEKQSDLEEMMRQLENSGNFVTVSIQLKEGKLVLPLELYVLNVVSSWTQTEEPLEYLKTLCVLCRTEVIRIGASRNNLQDIPSSELLDTYQYQELKLGQKKSLEKLVEAVFLTKGIIMTYDYEPIFCPFFALSAGCTRAASSLGEQEKYPYLQAKECETDYLSPMYLQKTSMSQKDFINTLQRNLTEITSDQTALENIAIQKIKVIKYPNSAYVKILTFNQQETLTITGDSFREWFQLPSSAFSIQLTNQGDIRIVTKGIGHGFGLCLYQAIKMANDGKSYQEILSYFFTKVKFDCYA